MSQAVEVVGRESEFGSVHEFLEAVPAGPIALLIEGEIGIGKTTLWREGIAAARERGLQVLTSRPVEAEIALPLAVLGDLLGDVSDAALGRLPDPQREALDVALLRTGTKPGGLQPRAVALAVLGAIRVLAEHTPLIVAIDDAQWLDPPSADALAFAARRLRDEPIGFLLARRGEGSRSEESGVELATALDSERLTRLLIGPLDIRSLDRLLRAQLGRQFLRPALLELQRVSEGNPFFALELGRALLTRDVSLAPGEPLPVPATLNELVRERLAGMPTAAREAALVVSALARPTVELVAIAVGTEGGTAALEKAAAAGVLEVAGGRVRFSHLLLASVVYAQTPPARRLELHARLAEIVGDPDEQALHLALAASGPDARVAATVENAARRARARGAPQAAAELWYRARMLTAPDDADAWRRAIEAGECHLDAGDTDRARRVLDEVVAHVEGGVPGADAPRRGPQSEVQARPAESGAPGHDHSRVPGANPPQRGPEQEVRTRRAEGTRRYIATHELDSGLRVGSFRDRRRRDVRSCAACRRPRLLRPPPASRHAPRARPSLLDDLNDWAPRGDDPVTTARNDTVHESPDERSTRCRIRASGYGRSVRLSLWEWWPYS